MNGKQIGIILAGILVIISIVVMIPTAGNNEIIGKWMIEWDDPGEYSIIEFKNNGVLCFDDYGDYYDYGHEIEKYDYYIDGNRIIMSQPDFGEEVMNYYFEGDTLWMTVDTGTYKPLERVSEGNSKIGISIVLIGLAIAAIIIPFAVDYYRKKELQ